MSSNFLRTPVSTDSGTAEKSTTLGENDNYNLLNSNKASLTFIMSPEFVEKIYLTQFNRGKGDLRKTFGNPTPVALVGFLLSLTPFACQLMEWRGSGGLGASDIGAYFFFGGLLMFLGGLGEWMFGETFLSVVFLTFGSFWFTFGSTLVPGYGAYAAFSKDPTSAPQEGLSSPTFLASFAFFLVFMGLLCLIFLVASIRTNVVLFLVFLLLVPAFELLAGAFWYNSQGHAATALKLQHATGGLLFVVCLLGWYLLTVVILNAVDFPFELPVGDLSTVVKGAKDLKKDPVHTFEHIIPA